MRCVDKCLGFFSVRIASIVFGFIIAIISALGTIGFFLFLFVGLSMRTDGQSTADGITLINLLLVEFTSSFVCSVLLLVGLIQKRPKLVASFLTYGMIQVVLLFFFFIVLRGSSHWFYTDHLFMAFFTLGFYSLCLCLVYVEYKRIIAEPTFENIQPELASLAGGPQCDTAPQTRN